jgi:hypothetical protein
MQDYRKPKQDVEARREKRRGRGRPRRTWEDREDFSRYEETGSR